VVIQRNAVRSVFARPPAQATRFAASSTTSSHAQGSAERGGASVMVSREYLDSLTLQFFAIVIRNRTGADTRRK